MKKIIMTIMGLGLCLGITSVVSAQDYSKSSRPWGNFKAVNNSKQYENLPEDATIAMACAKCKSVVVMIKKDLGTKTGLTKEEAATVDKCPGCGGKITTKGGKETAYVHTCSECGSDSAFCCATTSGEKTSGMSK